ncbi:AMP-binding protein [Thermomonospora amylolytica]|uniref:AMP-binding protein n=1 Tax=Thermomonospora amylolytica TaxID=1411117 RepID=UPI000E6BCC3F|nr:AMP-binding protein [Thermomonospora amylolytica]
MTTGVRFGRRKRSYDELNGRAARIAAGLDAMGVRAGDRVALMLRNEPAFLEVTAAAEALGASPVPVDWHRRGDGLAEALRGARAVFAHTDLVSAVEEALPEGAGVVEVRPPVELTAAYGLPPNGVTRRHPTLEAMIEGNEPWRAAPAADGARRAGLGDGFGLGPGMRTMVPAPLYDTVPNAHAVWAMRNGVDLTIMPRFDPEGLLRTVERNRIEHVQMTPDMFEELLRLPEDVRRRHDLSSLKAVVHAAPCPADVERAMTGWWGPVLRRYREDPRPVR